MPLGTAGLLSALVLAVSTIRISDRASCLRAGLPMWTSIATAFWSFSAFSGFAVYERRAFGTRGRACCRAGAWHRRPCAGRNLRGSPARGPGACGGATDHRAGAASQQPGQFAGPVILGLWVDHLGWQTASAIVVPVALFGLAAALVLRRILAIDQHR